MTDPQRDSGGTQALFAAAGGAASARSLTVVIVDDSEDNAELLCAVLEDRGHRVRTASNGASALRLLEGSVPDVVLLDIGLPEMDGYEVAIAIRARFGERVRLVALTGLNAAEARDRARSAGFDAFLEKPYLFGDVEAALLKSAP